MNPFETAAPAPFDLANTQKTIGNSLVGFVQLSLGGDAIKDDPEVGRKFFDGVKDSIVAGMAACNEVKRLQEALTGLRDKHQPRPHLDPAKPGALCAACSLHGALIAWPCETWTSVDKTLTHSQR